MNITDIDNPTLQFNENLNEQTLPMTSNLEEAKNVVEPNGDTYTICDNQSNTNSISLIHSNPDQNDIEHETMSQDSLFHDENELQHHPKTEDVSSSPLTLSRKLSINCQVIRTANLDEHIRLVKQKKEEAEVLRLRRFQEQLKKKEQKWQQQQLERVKKWLQLRNRDSDHRAQVEQRRRQIEEENRAKLEELRRREKEREQKANSNVVLANIRTNILHNPDGLMTVSNDISSNQRIRLRSNQQDMTHQQQTNDPQDFPNEQSNSANSSHQHDLLDGHQSRPLSCQSHDVTVTNGDTTESGTAQTTTKSRSRPVPTSYTYWLNTGETNHMNIANFMRLTYSATCRSRLSRSVERCPRASRGPEETSSKHNHSTTATEMQRRVQSINRQQLQETICRLAKPKVLPMAQSVQLSSVNSSTNGIPASHSSHQLRSSTPPVSIHNRPLPVAARNNIRRPYSARPGASARGSSSPRDNRASPVSETNVDIQKRTTNDKLSSTRGKIHSKPPVSSVNKPPIPSLSSSSSPRPKTATVQQQQRSTMTTSHSSSSISVSQNGTKSDPRRTPPVTLATSSRAKSIPRETIQLIDDSAPITNDEIQVDLVNETMKQESPTALSTPDETNPNESETTRSTNPTVVPSNSCLSKRELKILEEQEYQRKLSQKIREAQQKMELERQREEERQRQLEIEEHEREQEQIRLVEEQRRAEEERLQRAIRENESKRLEEARLQQQREEQEKRQAEEAERIQRERQEKAKKEEEERIERKKRLDLIMRRTRPVSPSSKNENLVQKSIEDENNGHDRSQSSMSHSISDQQFSSNSSSTENILNQTDSTITNETPKFKSPLIQNLLNKARNTRSTDNLTQSTNAISDEEQTDLDQTSIHSESTEIPTRSKSNSPITTA